MWLSDRTKRLFLMGAVCALAAACGFAPVYGPQRAATQFDGRIAVRAPENADEFAFAGALSDRLGTGETAVLLLDYKLAFTTSGFEGSANERRHLNGSAHYQLSRPDGSGVVASGNVENFVAWSEPKATQATTNAILSARYAREDAKRRLAAILAGQVVEKLYVDMARLAP